MKAHISDETLTAYLDGELSADERKGVSTALANQPELKVRLQALEVSKEAIKAGFDDFLLSAPQPPALPAFAQPTTQKRYFPIAASLAVGLILGAFASYLITLDTKDDWKVAIAKYQVLYVPETLMAAPAQNSGQVDTLDGLSKSLGRDLTQARFVDGLDFRRAQMLGLEGKPLVQMAYLSDDKTPFAICITEVGSADYEPKSEPIEGLAAAHWVKDGFGYLVIGGKDSEFVKKIAENIHTKI